jgi:excisionase family DNA binding protein
MGAEELTMPEISDYVTIQEAARQMGMTRASVYKIIERGALTAEQHLGKQLLKKEDVAAYQRVHRGWPKGKPRKSATEEIGTTP